VREEQEVLAHIANIVIETYAIESGLARAEKIARGEGSRGDLALDVARVYANDAADRIAHAGKQVVNAIAGRSAQIDTLRGAHAAIANHPGMDTVAARRRIGDAAVQAARYPF
jgi:hypothetical protein